MHPHRLEQLVASVPATIDPRSRARLDAHSETSEGCRRRIETVRAELERALDGAADAEGALDLACRLDTLERVQQRLDHRLAALVEALTRTPSAVDYGDGVPV
ncbi:hypothetical protein [Pseudonocardia asaccharolytica]|uniref:Uncharacterized protein n=1 Tax=Pseudonocardia asaccharolytica DSM 44247 = NBRC 16224 TaxID=1123024 RepID=A0A511D5Q3_9PSEU|nr:hypothetical protein [Pseudonocardia asaccharolytica]GEL20126.1 hypothetical protein PA7_39630 [Pseudonocardia asaccharolytica DSM 44247 = NBRC 16224]